MGNQLTCRINEKLVDDIVSIDIEHKAISEKITKCEAQKHKSIITSIEFEKIKKKFEETGELSIKDERVLNYLLAHSGQ
jgi:hypothetical protein